MQRKSQDNAMTELEYEKKMLLTKAEYAALAERYRGMPTESQTNRYFDTEDFDMNRRGITCRIRAKNGAYRTTVKNHGLCTPDCSAEAHLYEGTGFHSGVFEALGLSLQGELTTERLLLYQTDFCKTVLDRNTYLGYTDYEIEAEYTAGHEKQALHCLRRAASELAAEGLIDSAKHFMLRIGVGKSKSERFFERKNTKRRVISCNPF